MDQVETAFYIRLSVKHKAGVLAEVTAILGDKNISIEAFLQKVLKEGSEEADIILLTNVVNEGDMNDALAQIEALDVINGKATRIRVESLS